MTDADSMKFTGFKEPQAEARIRELLTKWQGEGGGELGVWAVDCCESGDFVGWSMLKRNNSKEPELGYMVAIDQRGKGFASELSATLLNYAFKDLKLARVTAITSPQNTASIKVLEKNGMKRVNEEICENGGVWYEVFRKDYPFTGK